METIKLYDKDAYQTAFEGMVVSCVESVHVTSEDENGVRGEEHFYDVILDQTVFFPEEGGQSPDQGILGGAKVIHVRIKDDVITHVLDQPLPEGQMVKGEIDWKHRFSNMQQHSGEHIFSGLVYKKYGYLNVGFHLSNQIVTMDFNGPLTAEQIEELEWEVNEAIVANVGVKTGYPSKEELAKMEYRSKKELDGAIRIVEVEGYDVCACCAPHVAKTGEIGGFKIQTVQNYKGGVRISFLCGFRGLEEYRKKSKIISELSGILTTNQELLAENVKKLKNTTQALKQQLGFAKQEIMEQKLEKMPAEQENVLLFEKDLDAAVMRNVVNKLVEQYDGVCGVFVGEVKTGYNFILGSKTLDCRVLATALRKELDAKGGGSAAMIQGTVKADEEVIRQVICNQS